MESVPTAEDSPTVVRVTMEAGLMVVRVTIVAGPVMANSSPMVVRLTMETTLVVVKVGLMMVRMTMVAQGWASRLSRR